MGSQSHLRGIETSVSECIMNNVNNSQSHLRGIETKYYPNRGVHDNTPNRTLEELKQPSLCFIQRYRFTPNRTLEELKHTINGIQPLWSALPIAP